jgi:uncharacterized membrane protein HdeD (DUF308 family)
VHGNARFWHKPPVRRIAAMRLLSGKTRRSIAAAKHCRVDLALAAIIFFGWPLSAGRALGLLVGINLITSGWAIVMAAFGGRSVARAGPRP